MKKLFYTVLIILLIGCTAKQTPIPDSDSNDARFYIEKCSPCHSVPHPKRNTQKQWEHIMSVMDKEIKHKDMPELTAKDKEIILNYLKKNAR